MDTLTYLSGFHQFLSSEAIAGTLPKRQFSPQHCPHGLYAEQISGSAFTAPRHEHKKTWVYRILPSVKHSPNFKAYQHSNSHFQAQAALAPPTAMRWNPLPTASSATDFVDSWYSMAMQGSPLSHQGGAIHHYSITASMTERFFYNADGELLFIPWQGELLIHTELGPLHLSSGEILVIPRGLCFRVELLTESASGYLCENWGLDLRLPDRGPIGANGLAEERHFLSPSAQFEQRIGAFELICKFGGKHWHAEISHSPLNVVAWCGNYTPYKYDLSLFNPMNSVAFDHADPSIFTVLTSPSGHVGTANIDFVIFPSRWMVAEHSFRPPYYHRNIMSEYMGLIHGQYDAKPNGFVPGGSSLHNTMIAHGVDHEAYQKASRQELTPEKYENTLAFMLESILPWMPTQQALDAEHRQNHYVDCWQGLSAQFQESKTI